MSLFTSLLPKATTSQANVNQNIVNRALQKSSTKCRAYCSQSISNITVIVGPNATVGDISFTQACTVSNVKCMINSIIDENIETILNNAINSSNTSSKPIFGLTLGSISNTADLEQQIRNQISQMISSTCTFDINQTMDGNYVYVGSNATTGNISFTQNADITSVECAIDIASKAVSYNTATSSINSSSTSISWLYLLIILIIVGFIVYIVAKVGFSKVSKVSYTDISHLKVKND